MIPEGALIPSVIEVEEVQQPSLTWKIDFEKGRIVGKTDGLEAIKQSVMKILLTDRFRHLIYSPNYGSELHDLIGSEPAFVRSELKRRITEALLHDDRIEEVTNFDVQINGDSATVRFLVVTTEGAFTVEREVT